MHRFTAFIAALMLLSPVTAMSAEPVVRVAQGELRGQPNGTQSTIFRAIPFAAPPVGDLRWKAPQPPANWDGVREGYDSAPACLQVSYGWNENDARTSSEDCLYLEIATPNLKPEKPLPVMVWIHGGANRAGGGSGTVWSAIPSEGVVLVSVQYRLGVFGFLSHPALSAEQGGASGNYAVMDMVAALQWVKANIAQFGGDAANVTIFGHSAGSQDVGLLLSTPLSQGLFHKAILQSGTPQFGMAPRTLPQNEALGVELARGYTAHAPDSAEALRDLRGAPAMALQTSGDGLNAPIDDKSFIWLQAVVDGRVLPQSPDDLFRAGAQSRVPLIIGYSARELGLHGGPEALKSTLKSAYGTKAKKARKFYKGDDALMGSADLRLATDLTFRCPADRLAWYQVAAGQPVWLYQLEVHNPGEAGKAVGHGSELHFLFNRNTEGLATGVWPPLLQQWTAFAKTGDPNGAGLPLWADYGTLRNALRFSAQGPVATKALRAKPCDWRDAL